MWHIYTDGACSGNPGPGGWGAILLSPKEEETELSGGSRGKCTTNNQMELLAVIESLKYLPEGAEATIHSDSQYVVKGMTEWLPGWKRSNFKNGQLLNLSLWKDLISSCEGRNLHWVWVRGHNGDKYNEKADQLARYGMTI